MDGPGRVVADCVGARHAEPRSSHVFWLRALCKEVRRPATAAERVGSAPILTVRPGRAERSQPTASAVGTGRSSPGALKGAIQLSLEPCDNRPPCPRLIRLRQESRAQSPAGVACTALPGLLVFGCLVPTAEAVGYHLGPLRGRNPRRLSSRLLARSWFWECRNSRARRAEPAGTPWCAPTSPPHDRLISGRGSQSACRT